jgi:hypothetical protein
MGSLVVLILENNDTLKARGLSIPKLKDVLRQLTRRM